jgi:acetyl esterase/lipase
MTEFNWEYVAAHPFQFAAICALYSARAVGLSISRSLTAPFATHATNYVTALKSLLLRTFFRHNYRFIYTAPKAAATRARRIDGNGWEAYEVEIANSPKLPLRDYDAVMLYFHGGGYILGDPLQYGSAHRRWKAKAAELGFKLAIVALRYREFSNPIPANDRFKTNLSIALSGEKPYPAQQTAAIEAYQYLIQKEQVEPGQIILAGDSAGGKSTPFHSINGEV